MIIEYHRPKTLEEALILLARKSPPSYPLGGGTFLNRSMKQDIAVIDLQALPLRSIERKGNQIHAGAGITLQQLMDFKGLAKDFYTAIQLEASYNLRQMATIAGTLVTANGRSPFTTVLLSLNVELVTQSVSKSEKVKLGDWLLGRDPQQPNRLITEVIIPVNNLLAYEYVARSPADQPIVCASAARWSNGRTRLTLGGWGSAPLLAMDGPSPDGIELAARSAYAQAQDEWASSAYRQEIAGVLALRCLKKLIQEAEQ